MRAVTMQAAATWLASMATMAGGSLPPALAAAWSKRSVSHTEDANAGAQDRKSGV